MKIATLHRMVAAVILTGLSACTTPPVYDGARVGPYFRPANHSGKPSVAGVRRVVLLPLFAGEVASPESALALDAVLAAGLQAQQRFEVVVLSREECRHRFGVSEFSSSGALPHDLLAFLRREHAADAVVFVDLTVFQAYRPLALGFRAKLAALDTGTLVWSFDNVYAMTDRAVANSARHHYLQTGSGVPADLSAGVLHSPTRFGAYAASSMFATLPPTLPPIIPVPKSAKSGRSR